MQIGAIFSGQRYLGVSLIFISVCHHDSHWLVSYTGCSEDVPESVKWFIQRLTTVLEEIGRNMTQTRGYLSWNVNTFILRSPNIPASAVFGKTTHSMANPVSTMRLKSFWLRNDKELYDHVLRKQSRDRYSACLFVEQNYWRQMFIFLSLEPRMERVSPKATCKWTTGTYFCPGYRILMRKNQFEENLKSYQFPCSNENP